MTILDSNVISALMSDPPDSKVIAWLDQQPRTSIWTTAISILEIRSGLQMMPLGGRQKALSERFERMIEGMGHRVAAFDEESACEAATLMAVRKSQGKVIETRDTMIAGIVLARRASLATRNTNHFNDISATVINPWAS